MYFMYCGTCITRITCFVGILAPTQVILSIVRGRYIIYGVCDKNSVNSRMISYQLTLSDLFSYKFYF